MTPNRKNNTINYKKESKFGPWTQEEREAGRRRKDLKRVTSMTTMELLKKARGAKGALALADTELKNRALMEMARALEDRTADILAANVQDLEAARGTISEVMLDRLALSPERIAGMAQGMREVAALPDPVGAVLSRVERPNGLVIEKTAVPMGAVSYTHLTLPTKA